jgi:hypothetical protein
MSICGCASVRKSFGSEIALHFPGLDGLTKPIVWLFPAVEVCLNCGTAEFVVPETEREALLRGQRLEGAAASNE